MNRIITGAGESRRAMRARGAIAMRLLLAIVLVLSPYAAALAGADAACGNPCCAEHAAAAQATPRLAPVPVGAALLHLHRTSGHTQDCGNAGDGAGCQCDGACASAALIAGNPAPWFAVPPAAAMAPAPPGFARAPMFRVPTPPPRTG